MPAKDYNDRWDEAIGHEALLQVKEDRAKGECILVYFPVRVIGVKRLFGRVFLQVIPRGGKGEVSVRPPRLTFQDWVAPVYKEPDDG